MEAVFYNCFATPTGVERSEVGRVALIDGKISITPPLLDRWLRTQTSRKGRTLDPTEGTKYLRLLPQVFQGAYLYAVLEKGTRSEKPSRSRKVLLAIARTTEELKRYQKTAKVERAIAIDLRTGQVLYDALGTAEGIDVSKGFSDDAKPLGERGKKAFLALPRWSVLDIHTHLDDLPFSAMDWGSFAWDQIFESRLITDDAVYWIRKTPAFQELPKGARTSQTILKRFQELEKKQPQDGGKKRALLACRALATELHVVFGEDAR